MKRHFVWCICAYLLVTYLILSFGVGILKILIPAFSLCIICLTSIYIFTKKSLIGSVIVIVIFALVATFKTAYIDIAKIEGAKQYDSKYLETEGKVVSFGKSNNFVWFTVDCDSLNSRVKVSYRGNDLDVDIGKNVRFSGKLEFDEKENRDEETFLSTYTTNVEVLKSDSLNVKFRAYIRKALDRSRNKGLLTALLIGDKSLFDSQITTDFQKLGTSHILSISGLHLSIVVMSFYLFLSSIGAGRRFSSLAGIVVALIYMSMTGFAISVVRAGQMTILYLTTRLIRRTNDSITALFFSGFLIVLRSAWSIYSLSFLLSFFATLGILAFLPSAMMWFDKIKLAWIEKNGYPPQKMRLIFKLCEYFLVSLYSTLSATLFTLPIVIMSFNAVSLISPFSNLLLIFFAKYVLMFSLVGSIVSFIPLLSDIILYIGDLLASIMLFVTEILVKISPDLVGVDIGFIIPAVIMSLAFVTVSLFFSRKILTLPITSIVLVIAFCIFNSYISLYTYDHVRVSPLWRRGYNSVIVSSQDKTFLLDQSNGGVDVSLIPSALKKRRTETIDEAIIVVNNQKAVERVKSLADILDIKKFTLLINPEVDVELYECIKKCQDNEIDTKMIYQNTYEPSDNITFTRAEELYEGFTVVKNNSSMGFYKVISKENTINLPSTDVVFYDGDILFNDGVKYYDKGELPTSFWRINEKRIIRE